jgi:glycosyltransferase involved in cell wall biosynthesis
MTGPAFADRAETATVASVGLSVVIPVLDERESLLPLFAEIEAACDRLDCRWEVVWVDDGSTDGSADVLEQLALTHDNVRLVRLRRNFGKSAALRAGFVQSRGEIVATMDADGQDDPAELPVLVARLKEGYDVVSGWKRKRQDPLLKRWSSRLFNATSARLSGVPLHDVNCGLKVYRGDAVRELDFYGEQHRLIPILGFQRGWRVAELPVHHRARTHGRSKFGTERYVRGLLDLCGVALIGRYQYRPLHLFGGAGLACGLVGIVLCLYLTVERITGHEIGNRPLLDLGILMIIAGIQFFTIGLLAEMITATRQDVRAAANTQLVERVIEQVIERGERSPAPAGERRRG